MRGVTLNYIADRQCKSYGTVLFEGKGPSASTFEKARRPTATYFSERNWMARAPLYELGRSQISFLLTIKDCPGAGELRYVKILHYAT